MSKRPDTETEVRNLHSLVSKMQINDTRTNKQTSSTESHTSPLSSPTGASNAILEVVDNLSPKNLFRTGSARSSKRSFIVPETNLNQLKNPIKKASSNSKPSIDRRPTREDSLESDCNRESEAHLVLSCNSEPVHDNSSRQTTKSVALVQNDDDTSSDCDDPHPQKLLANIKSPLNQLNNHNNNQMNSNLPKSFYLNSPTNSKEINNIHSVSVNNNSIITSQKLKEQPKRRSSKVDIRNKKESVNDEESWLMKVPATDASKSKPNPASCVLSSLTWMREVFDSDAPEMKQTKLWLLIRLQEIERSQRLYGQGSQPNLFTLQPYSLSGEPSMRRHSRPLTGDYSSLSMPSHNLAASKQMQTTGSQTDLYAVEDGASPQDQPTSLSHKASSSENISKGYHSSHERLHDIRDVRNMAKMQEEQLKAHVMQRRRSRTDLTSGNNQESRKISLQNPEQDGSLGHLSVQRTSKPVERSNSSSNSDIDKKAFQSNALANEKSANNATSRSKSQYARTGCGIPQRTFSSISGNVKDHLNRSRSSQNVSTIDPTRLSTEEEDFDSPADVRHSSGDNLNSDRYLRDSSRQNYLRPSQRAKSGDNLATQVGRARSFNSPQRSNLAKTVAHKSSEEDLNPRLGSTQRRRSQPRVHQSPNRASNDAPIAPPRHLRTLKKSSSDRHESQSNHSTRQSASNARGYATVQYYEENF